MDQQIKEGYCNHCGAKIKKYTYTLTPTLVDVLIEIHKIIYRKKENRVSMKELREHLQTYQYTQLSKLRFLGLIFKNLENEKFTGEWGITARGGSFLRREARVPKRVVTFRNRVQHELNAKTELVSISDVYAHQVPYIEGLDSINYSASIANAGEQASAVIDRSNELPRKKYMVIDHNKYSSTFRQVIVVEIEKAQPFMPIVVYRGKQRQEFSSLKAFAKHYTIERVLQ